MAAVEVAFYEKFTSVSLSLNSEEFSFHAHAIIQLQYLEPSSMSDTLEYQSTKSNSDVPALAHRGIHIHHRELDQLGGDAEQQTLLAAVLVLAREPNDLPQGWTIC